MPEKLVITGNFAAAYACKSANVDVVAAYPITPQSPVVEKISEFVESGEMPDTQFICVESEHSAMAACVGAAEAGARVFTASSANGLALMFELLCWCAGARLPAVVCIASRALGAPWTVWTDHQDAISMRDTGFMHQFCETNQEIYDSVLMAYRIAEDPRVFLPMFVTYDGYLLSHTMMPVQIEDPEKVRDFLPPLKTHVDVGELGETRSVSAVIPPDITVRPEGNTPGYMEYRYAMQKAHEYAIDVIEEVNREFKVKFGRSYGNGIYTSYKIEDADILIFGIGSVASQSRMAVDQLRSEGIKAGLISLKLFRPFPVKHLREIFTRVPLVVVFDRDVAYGYEGVLAYELKAALYPCQNRPIIRSYIVGLGGRNIPTDTLTKAVKRAIKEKDDSSVQLDPHTDFLDLDLDRLGLSIEDMQKEAQ
ncbi:pyruvate ferredoxin oxidoreductase [bacterium]|nr:pyruvate ferredoxin oxidoreductase [candidate division CSSED10-310 bacterium]